MSKGVNVDPNSGIPRTPGGMGCGDEDPCSPNNQLSGHATKTRA